MSLKNVHYFQRKKVWYSFMDAFYYFFLFIVKVSLENGWSCWNQFYVRIKFLYTGLVTHSNGFFVIIDGHTLVWKVKYIKIGLLGSSFFLVPRQRMDKLLTHLLWGQIIMFWPLMMSTTFCVLSIYKLKIHWETIPIKCYDVGKPHTVVSLLIYLRK